MSIDKLTDAFDGMSTFCSSDEYQELVRNNSIVEHILQTNILNNDFFDYICFKFNYYREKINFDYSKHIYPEYSLEIEEIKIILDEFLLIENIKDKLLLAKEFHNKVINTINAIECFYSVFN